MPNKTEIPKLIAAINPDKLPAHIAIIMDGNGRWAKQRHYPRIEGHRNGIKSVRDIVEGCCDVGVKYLTLYAFSIENWQRPKTEVSALMRLMEKFLYDEVDNMNRNGIRLLLTGRREGLPAFVLKAMDDVMQSTVHNQRLVLNLAFNYGSKTEMEDAVKQIAGKVQSGELSPDTITVQTIADHLYSPWIPDPDLLIRTSGEQRISNFLLWQIAYAELYFTEVLWPDFKRQHLFEAILAYQKRERRFGSI